MKYDNCHGCGKPENRPSISCLRKDAHFDYRYNKFVEPTGFAIKFRDWLDGLMANGEPRWYGLVIDDGIEVFGIDRDTIDGLLKQFTARGGPYKTRVVSANGHQCWQWLCRTPCAAIKSMGAAT